MISVSEHTSNKLVVKGDPRIGFGIAMSLGLLATVGALISVFDHSKEVSTNDILGIVLGSLFALGALILYRKTTTVFDKRSGLVHWNQRGLRMNKSDSAQLAEIVDVVVGRPVSDQSGGATCLVLVLSDRRWPLSFGFSALNHRDREIAKTIKMFVGNRAA
jgi:uncharacterized membrane protein (UPF0136 family)